MDGQLKRSIPEEEYYAAYLLLPLLGFGKEDIDTELVSVHATTNGKIAVVLDEPVQLIRKFPKYYLTDFPYQEHTLVLFECPKEFETDMHHFLYNEFSHYSYPAKQLVYTHSGLVVDFKTNKQGIITHRLIRALRGELTEPELREQDILTDIDTDYVKGD